MKIKKQVIQIVMILTITILMGIAGTYEPVSVSGQIPDTFSWITREVEDEKDDKFKTQHNITNDLISDICGIVRIVCIGVICIGLLIIAITLALSSSSEAVSKIKERIFRHFIGCILYFGIPVILAFISTITKAVVESFT